MSETYGLPPGLELTTGGCEHRFATVAMLEHEERMRCSGCFRILPRRRGFWSGGRREQERFEQALQDSVRKGEIGLVRARLEREKDACRAVREAMRVLPVFRTPDAPRRRYAAPVLAARL